jgi:hypothetical protein
MEVEAGNVVQFLRHNDKDTVSNGTAVRKHFAGMGLRFLQFGS